MPLFKSSREVLLNTELAKTPFWFLMILHEKVLSAAAAVSRVLVKVDPKYFRPTEVDLLVGDCSKAKKLLGWAPKVTFKALAEEMVDADLAELRHELAQAGQ